MGRRPGLLAYQTDVLTNDITLAGPILANLWISTSATASDWIVKATHRVYHSAANPTHLKVGVLK